MSEVENSRVFGLNWGMKRRGTVVVVTISVLLVAALVFALRGSEQEPRFEGRTLSSWLLRRDPHLRTLTLDQEQAIRTMGTNALPFLLKWMQYEYPAWRVRLERIVPRSARLGFLFTDERAERAMLSEECLSMLGPDVAPAMPELVKMLKQTNAVSPTRALQVVDSVGKVGIPVLLDVLTNRQSYPRVYYLEGAMGRLGPDGHFAVPPLLACLTNRNWGVVVVAARWLGRIRMDPEVTVPALASCLDAPEARVKCAALQALGQFRADAAGAIPFVARELNDPDNDVRAAAQNALRCIEQDFTRGEHW
jgi:HEAT repeat protein